MKTYFLLQLKMCNRKLIAFGLPPLVAYLGFPIAFVLLANYLFSQTPFAGAILIVLALSLFISTSAPQRNEFLKSIYNRQQYRILRLLENLIIGLPFLAFLIYKQGYGLALVLAVLAATMALVNFGVKSHLTLPTPFGKKPFEFTVGFRKTFWLYPIAYFLTYRAIQAQNVNLGIFALILMVLTAMSYYLKPENAYLVWNFSRSPKAFLIEKIKIALTHFTVLSLPTLIGLAIFFKGDILLVIGFFMLGLLYLATVVMAKYSAYPREMEVPQGILIAVSLLFPPMLLGILPYFYTQSVKNLNPLLNDPN